MGKFKRFLDEDEHETPFSKPEHPDHDLWKHGVPAMQNIYSKKVHRGKRGEAHWEMAEKLKHTVPHGHDPFDHLEPGYFHTKHKTFHARKDTRDMDSTDLMTKMQRDRYRERTDK